MNQIFKYQGKYFVVIITYRVYKALVTFPIKITQRYFKKLPQCKYNLFYISNEWNNMIPLNSFSALLIISSEIDRRHIPQNAKLQIINLENTDIN